MIDHMCAVIPQIQLLFNFQPEFPPQTSYWNVWIVR